MAWLDPEKNYYPTGGYEVAHDVGRWWDAMLRYESVTGIPIPEQAEKQMFNNIQALMANPTGMLVGLPDIDWMKEKAKFNPHNIRESFLALTALVKYRSSEWAEQTGHRLLVTLKKIRNEDHTFDFMKMAALSGAPAHPGVIARSDKDGTTTFGRALEAILLFYEATGDKLAMEIAEGIASYHLSHTVNQDGTAVTGIFSPDNIGHNHSYLGTLRGLLLFGLKTGSDEYVHAVSHTYDRSLWENNITWVGWAPHDLGKPRFNNEDGDPEADPASCGDVAQIALWLAMYAGRDELYDDVERLVRATLLSSQITEDLAPRKKGAWGIHRHPFGQGVILDVFAAVLHTLTDVYSNIFTIIDEDNININMNFDIDSDQVNIQVTADEMRKVKVSMKKLATLKIRVPGWVDKTKVQLKIDGINVKNKVWDGQYIIIGKNDLNDKSVIELIYDLPETVTVEIMKVSKKEFRLTWKGDEVVNCIPAVLIYPCVESK